MEGRERRKERRFFHSNRFVRPLFKLGLPHHGSHIKHGCGARF